ncbi:amino acid adenylation domain-containing protein [Nonomuraea sp. FMUSA5-5]|uniref:Amino acid adenylation domain-containing protein n=1 Tax=Nonomuraea composti TaxID=2720023 RepID=A0ABX1BI58_9ACTN|nr:AMP-binding protein [Nonomuraea sp. FMUSA5-5]NJP95434.1 amino acid adenylation domain-containing protein [Nonomuraea sp. FMUSA5-5]
MSNTLLDAIAAQATAHPEALAVTDTHLGHTLSYADLIRDAAGVAGALQPLNVAGSTVLLALPPGTQWCAALLGIWQAGAVAAFVDISHPPGRLAAITDACSTRTAITPDGKPPRWAADTTAVAPGATTGVTLDQPPATSGCVFHTSGSTGTPKPVLVRQDALAARTEALRTLYGFTPSDRIAQLTAPCFDAVLWELLPTLTAGAHLLIPGPRHRSIGSELVAWLHDQRITAFTCTPTTLTTMPFAELDALRLIVLGGETLHTAPLKQWLSRYRVANAYGPTEATVEAVMALPITPDLDPVPIGRPLPGVITHVLTSDGQAAAAGEVGELYLGGMGLAEGYLGMSRETASRFVHLDLDGAGPRRFYRTGDLVRELDDGQLTFVGRADQQLNLGGVRLEPGEIEAIALRMPGVQAAAVCAVPAPDGPALSLYAVASVPVTVAQLRRHLAAHLPPSAVPSRLRLVADLPRTTSGKLDRGALTKLGHPPPVHPDVDLPEDVALLWQRLTGTSPTGADFFADGGDSIAVPALVHGVNESHATRITITDFTADPTPACLALAITTTRKELP